MSVIEVSSVLAPASPLRASTPPTSTTSPRQLNNHSSVSPRSTTKPTSFLRPPPISPIIADSPASPVEVNQPNLLTTPEPDIPLLPFASSPSPHSDSDDSGANPTDVPTDVPTDAPTDIEAAPHVTNDDNNIADNAKDGNESSTKPTKPKSKAKQRVERAPPARPPPMLTVRLDINLGGPSDYEVNILNLAKATGQRQPTPPPPPRDSDTDSSSEDEPAPTAPDAVQKVKSRRKRREIDYDFEDPFIDDSDLIIDAPTHFGQTKQQGFYVNLGDVVLVKDKSPVKDKTKAPRSSAPGHLNKPRGSNLTSLLLQATTNATAPTKAPITLHSLSSSTSDPFKVITPQLSATPDGSFHHQDPSHSGLGTRDSPIALLDDDDEVKPMMNHPPPSPTAHHMPAAKKLKMDDGGSAVTRHSGASGSGRSSEAMEDGKPDVKSAVANLLSGNEHVFAAPANVSMSSSTSAKKRRISKEDIERFSPEVIQALTALKRAVETTAFTAKGKFPPMLKPPLIDTAKIAMRNGDYNDSFFDFLPFVFPYNRFTMMKLTSRLLFTEHQRFLAERQDQILDELRIIAVQDFERAQEEYARNCMLWDEKQKKKGGTEGGVSSSNPNAMDVDTVPSRVGSPNGLAPNTNNGAETSDTGAGNATAPAIKTREREEKPPQQKYKWTDDIKARVWGLVHLSNEMCRIQNEMAKWEPEKVSPVTEQGLRKGLYARIISVFPEGWMTSQTISREVSNMKLKLKKEEEAAAKAEDGGEAGPSNHAMDD